MTGYIEIKSNLIIIKKSNINDRLENISYFKINNNLNRFINKKQIPILIL